MADDLGHYYLIATATRVYYYLDMAEGDRVVTILDRLRDNFYAREHDAADPMFIEFTDRSGSNGRIRAAQIEAIYTSTPESRAQDEAWEQRQKAANPTWKDDT